MTDLTLEPALPNQPIEIVLIEADTDLREVLADVLFGAGHFVRAFGDAESAHAAVLREIPDVVLLHLGRPSGLTGSAFAERIRQEPRTRHVAIVAMTGEVTPSYEFVKHVDAYLRKPMQSKTLLERVRTLALRARARRREPAAAPVTDV